MHVIECGMLPKGKVVMEALCCGSRPLVGRALASCILSYSPGIVASTASACSASSLPVLIRIRPRHSVAKEAREFTQFRPRSRISTNSKVERTNCGRVNCTIATQSVHLAAEESTMKEAPKEIFLKDYKSPDYFFDTVNLCFVLGEEATTVVTTVKVLPKAHGTDAPLVLDGLSLKLLHIKINGKEVEMGNYKLTDRQLVLTSLPSEPFELETAVEIYPQSNTSLEGLYKSSAMFCTQCEAVAFRKITYFQDRPDVMAKFTTRIEANKERYPVLLSNGNLIAEGDLEDGKHFAVWEDPFKKPSYLFALVAGKLTPRDDKFITMSGREVLLRIWTPAEDVAKTAHAMHSLKAAMKWDEEVFGLEYDLDLFNIVAVPDFNMGAMENKSLNIFNSKLVLATPETATDVDYSSIEGVIGHEYFHNWTGNRLVADRQMRVPVA